MHRLWGGVGMPWRSPEACHVTVEEIDLRPPALPEVVVHRGGVDGGEVGHLHTEEVREIVVGGHPGGEPHPLRHRRRRRSRGRGRRRSRGSLRRRPPRPGGRGGGRRSGSPRC
ncbi:hypothetical protein [Methanoculleus chikugoensis]|uniref:hypothetical protein n=1 Tax=Methanoculleus chikugoensis TaxID=118126 RepID=UPI001FB4B0F2|nr:hypothetical protein [Methanoculleus chikugoensis]